MWNGSAWKGGNKVWNGSRWVGGTEAKMWNGTRWEPFDLPAGAQFSTVAPMVTNSIPSYTVGVQYTQFDATRYISTQIANSSIDIGGGNFQMREYVHVFIEDPSVGTIATAGTQVFQDNTNVWNVTPHFVVVHGGGYFSVYRYLAGESLAGGSPYRMDWNSSIQAQLFYFNGVDTITRIDRMNATLAWTTTPIKLDNQIPTYTPFHLGAASDGAGRGVFAYCHPQPREKTDATPYVPPQDMALLYVDHTVGPGGYSNKIINKDSTMPRFFTDVYWSPSYQPSPQADLSGYPIAESFIEPSGQMVARRQIKKWTSHAAGSSTYEPLELTGKRHWYEVRVPSAAMTDISGPNYAGPPDSFDLSTAPNELYVQGSGTDWERYMPQHASYNSTSLHIPGRGIVLQGWELDPLYNTFIRIKYKKFNPDGTIDNTVNAGDWDGVVRKADGSGIAASGSNAFNRTVNPATHKFYTFFPKRPATVTQDPTTFIALLCHYNLSTYITLRYRFKIAP